jgi:hypothetical protein
MWRLLTDRGQQVWKYTVGEKKSAAAVEQLPNYDPAINPVRREISHTADGGRGYVPSCSLVFVDRFDGACLTRDHACFLIACVHVPMPFHCDQNAGDKVYRDLQALPKLKVRQPRRRTGRRQQTLRAGTN